MKSHFMINSLADVLFLISRIRSMRLLCFKETKFVSSLSSAKFYSSVTKAKSTFSKAKSTFPKVNIKL